MLQFLPIQDDNIFAVRASDKLSHEDYQAFLPELEKKIAEHGKISLFLELDDFDGWDLAAITEEFRWSQEHSGDFEKVAVVGEERWQQWMTLLAKPFTAAKIQYFSEDEASDAWNWLRHVELSDAELAAQAIVPYSKILVPVDFSPHSLNATKRAIELASFYDAEILMLNIISEEVLYDTVYSPGDMGFGGVHMPSDPAVKDVLTTSAESRMKQLQESEGLTSVSSEIVIGTPAMAIAAYSEKEDVDLIVMGTHGRKGMAKLLGSTARAVQSRVHCEVLMIPLNQKEERE